MIGAPRNPRRCRSLVLSITLGLVTTILVAWSCAMWSPVRDHGRTPSDPAPGEAWIGHSSMRGFGWHEQIEWQGKGAEGEFLNWRFTSRPIREAGWPWLSMRSVVRPYHDPTDPSQPALAFPELPMTELVRRGYPTERLPDWIHADGGRRVPCMPVWRGLVLDTICFAAAWWLLLFVPGRIRSHLRGRRELCPQCDIAVELLDTCSECGTPSREMQA